MAEEQKDQIFEQVDKKIPEQGNETHEVTDQSKFLALVKVFCYMALFVGMQFLVIIILQIMWGYERVALLSNQGINVTQEDLTQFLTQKTQESGNLTIILYELAFLIFLLIFFAIRRKNPLKEVGLNKFSPRYLLPVVLLGIGLSLFMNGALNLLPISIKMDYIESSNIVLNTDSALLLILSNLFFAPVGEEIAFRGLVYGRMKKAFPVWISLLFTSFFFGVVHLQILWLILAFLNGIVFCLIAEKTGSTAASLIAHILFNSGGVFLLTFGIPITMALVIVAIIVGAILIAAGTYLFYHALKKA